MKVFISWSGAVSHRVALVLRDWIPSVIQALEPYVSSEDIDKGARWSTDIAEELSGSNYGLLVVTKSNLHAPWLNFEAGALSKSFDSARVSPFLFGIKRSEVEGPLLQFQSTTYERDDVFKLMIGLNAACDNPLDPHRLDEVLDVWWPSLKEKLDAIDPDEEVEGSATSINGRDEAGILEEVLDLVRSQQRLLNSPDELLPPRYVEMIIERSLLGRSVHLEDSLMMAVDDLWDRFRFVERTVIGATPSADDAERDRELFVALREAIDRLEGPVRFLWNEYGRGNRGRLR